MIAKSRSDKAWLALDISYLAICLLLATVYLALFTYKIYSAECLYLKTDKGFVINSDFPAFYAAGEAASHGHIYSYQKQLELLNERAAPAHIEKVLRIPYPPHFYLLLLAAVQWPIKTAFVGWVTVGVILSLFCTYKISATNQLLSHASKLFYSFSVLSIFPTFYSMLTGQNNPLVMLAFTLLYLAIVGKKYILTAVALLLSTLKPQFTILLGIISLAQKNWKAMFLAALCTLLVLSVPCFVWGISVYDVYLKFLNEWLHESYAEAHPEKQVSIRWFIEFAPKYLQGILSAASLLGCLIYLYSIWRRVAQDTGLAGKAFTLSCSATLALLPHCHLYECGLLWAGAASSLHGVFPSVCRSLKNKADLVFHGVILTYPLIAPICFLLMPNFEIRASQPFAVVGLIAFCACAISFEQQCKIISDNSKQE